MHHDPRDSVSLLALLTNLPQLLLKRRQVLLNLLPHESQVHGEVAVDQPVSHAGDDLPGDEMVGRFPLIKKLTRGLSQDLNATNHCVVDEALRDKIVL